MVAAAARNLPEESVAGGNVVELVRRFASTQPGVAALVDKRTGKRRSFAELALDLDETAAALRFSGVKPGDRVALFVATGIEFVTLVFGCFQAGAVPVLIDPGMGAKNVLSCVKEQAPRALLGVAKAHVLALLARDAFRSVEIKLLAGGGWFPGAPSLQWTLTAAHHPQPDVSVHAAGADDVAAILYTSGSTGPPKGVVYTHGMLAAQSTAIRDMFDIRPGEIDVACFLPFGLFSVAMGMTAVFPDMDFRKPAAADPTRILEALEGATSAFASPALWEPFSHFMERRSGGPALGLRRVLTAGAPVRPSLHERMLKHLPQGDVFTPYGATEALPVSFMSGRAVVGETAALTRAGKGTCVGKLAPGIEVRIIAVTDDAIAHMKDARELERGEIGEICVRGPCVTQAYDNKPDANRKSKIADDDGARLWHRMGDVGYVDERGRLWFCGRKGHRVDVGATMLTSIPVEAIAETLWPERAALVGVDGRAVVVLESTQGKATAADAQRVLGELKKHDVARLVSDVVIHVGPFPVDRRHNAKIERERLAEWVKRKGARR